MFPPTVSFWFVASGTQLRSGHLFNCISRTISELRVPGSTHDEQTLSVSANTLPKGVAGGFEL